ncbi:twin-arginine translocation signal domain-containing protein [Streptomyces sp. R28]|uniref:Twin-arginine translocation signal domain-containing protein n=1 Tax=Streptomyces sp. R28 TaxID=3238628 RepID=A0AB39QAN9_9ACTN
MPSIAVAGFGNEGEIFRSLGCRQGIARAFLRRSAAAGSTGAIGATGWPNGVDMLGSLSSIVRSAIRNSTEISNSMHLTYT